MRRDRTKFQVPNIFLRETPVKLERWQQIMLGKENNMITQKLFLFFGHNWLRVDKTIPKHLETRCFKPTTFGFLNDFPRSIFTIQKHRLHNEGIEEKQNRSKKRREYPGEGDSGAIQIKLLLQHRGIFHRIDGGRGFRPLRSSGRNRALYLHHLIGIHRQSGGRFGATHSLLEARLRLRSAPPRGRSDAGNRKTPPPFLSAPQIPTSIAVCAPRSTSIFCQKWPSGHDQ